MQNLCIEKIFTIKCKSIVVKAIKGKIRKSEVNKCIYASVSSFFFKLEPKLKELPRCCVSVSSVGHSSSLSSNVFPNSGDSNSHHEFQVMVVVCFSFSGFWKRLVLKRRVGRILHCSTCGCLCLNGSLLCESLIICIIFWRK